MAKKNEDNAKIRFIFVEMEGSNEALQKSVSDVVRAISRPASERVIGPPAKPAPALQEPPEDEDEMEDAEYLEESASSSSSKRSSKTRKPPKLEILDIDLDAGDVPFKDYIREKNPTKNTKRYLVIMAWLKEHGGISVVNKDHIHTCYRTLGLNTPKDPTAAFRALKQRGWINSASGQGAYEINHVGEGVVNDLDAE